MRGLWACSDLTVIEANAEAPDGAAFEGGLGAEVKTRDPKMAKFLAALAAAFPLAIPLETASESPLLSEKILQLFVSEVIQLTTAQLPIVAVPGERPQVSPLSSLQAANGETALATLRHAMVQIDDASVRALVPLIDGTRRREELALDIAQRDDISAAGAVRRLDEILAKFARAGLLAG